MKPRGAHSNRYKMLPLKILANKMNSAHLNLDWSQNMRELPATRTGRNSRVFSSPVLQYSVRN